MSVKDRIKKLEQKIGLGEVINYEMLMVVHLDKAFEESQDNKLVWKNSFVGLVSGKKWKKTLPLQKLLKTDPKAYRQFKKAYQKVCKKLKSRPHGSTMVIVLVSVNANDPE